MIIKAILAFSVIIVPLAESIAAALAISTSSLNITWSVQYLESFRKMVAQKKNSSS